MRGATSIVSDQYGRLLGMMRADGASDGVMVVSVPGTRVPTVYARTGEVVPTAALAFCLIAMVRVVRAPLVRAPLDVLGESALLS